MQTCNVRFFSLSTTIFQFVVLYLLSSDCLFAVVSFAFSCIHRSALFLFCLYCDFSWIFFSILLPFISNAFLMFIPQRLRPKCWTFPVERNTLVFFSLTWLTRRFLFCFENEKLVFGQSYLPLGRVCVCVLVSFLPSCVCVSIDSSKGKCRSLQFRRFVSAPCNDYVKMTFSSKKISYDWEFRIDSHSCTCCTQISLVFFILFAVDHLWRYRSLCMRARTTNERAQ